MQIGSKEWYSDLTLLGFTPSKSKTLTLPPIPDVLFGHFVRGYFDGDGCVYFSMVKRSDDSQLRWMLLTLFTSGSLSFLQKLHNQLKAGAIRKGSITRKERGFELRFSRGDSLALWRLMYDTAQVSNLYLPRKREKLERAIQVLGLDKELRS